MKLYCFDGASVRSLRSLVTTHWLSMMSVTQESQWRRSELNPTALLEYFGPLRLKDGYVLRAYERHKAPDSWGAVWAWPAKMPFPEPRPNGNGFPHKPDGALDNVMEAIEGDGTPYSYLCASLLGRELEQFASLTPGSEWLNCFVLDCDPWNSANGLSHALKGQGFTLERGGWKWNDQRPGEWRPSVLVSQRSVTVIFHAFTGVGRQRIITYEDRFLRGSYAFNRHERPLASGPMGYTW